MTAWAQGQNQKYLLASETHYFAKLALALALHEVDEAVLDRQRAEWIADLGAMLVAQAPPPVQQRSPLLVPGQPPRGAAQPAQ